MGACTALRNEDVWTADDELDEEAMDNAWIAKHQAYIAQGEQHVVESCNRTEFSAYTSGYAGGNSGCVTALRISDLASTQWDARIVDSDVCVILEGDCELSTFITGLRFLADSLENQATKANIVRRNRKKL